MAYLCTGKSLPSSFLGLEVYWSIHLSQIYLHSKTTVNFRCGICELLFLYIFI